MTDFPRTPYLIVMKRFKDGRSRLITAHWLNYDSKRRNLLKKFQKRVVG